METNILTLDKYLFEDAQKYAFKRGTDLTKLVDDLEDAMQYFSAVGAKVDVVLTRNKKDFIEISVPVMTPDEFFID